MDQIKIGKFIAELRKEKGLTQTALAEKLMISNKTVSKWETGKGLPEVSLMIPLCEELGINVNELLTGERIPEKNYIEKAEENMVKLVNEAQEAKRKIVLSLIIAGFTLVASVPLFIVAGTIEMPESTKWILNAIAAFVLLGGITLSGMIDMKAGAFECPECKSRFVPDAKAYLMGYHTITKRKLECPHCHKKTFCKLVMKKPKD